MVLFLIGLAVSIPLSIFANLMTDRLRHAWAKRNAAARAKESAANDKLRRLGMWFTENPHAYHAYATREAMRMLLTLPAVGLGILLISLFWDDLTREGGSSSTQVMQIWGFLVTLAGLGLTLVAATTTVKFYARFQRLFDAVRDASHWPVDPESLELLEQGMPEGESGPEAPK